MRRDALRARRPRAKRTISGFHQPHKQRPFVVCPRVFGPGQPGGVYHPSPSQTRAPPFYSPRCFCQVCTAAANLLVGNSPRATQPCMLRFFSTHIAAGDFDPTGDVVSQLKTLNDRQPCPIPDYNALLEFITKKILAAKEHDNKLRAKGEYCLLC
jgi:hypothetical protein